VRFHALPESKRYPESETEYATVLARHAAILHEMGLGDTCFVITAWFVDEPSRDPSRRSSVHAGAERWRTMPADDWREVPTSLYASEVRHPSGDLDLLLRAVADEQLVGTMITPRDLSWIYHPYDGGADLITRSSDERDALRTTFNAWLSPFPHGL
jgi:hypothetical protein